ncbi:MAG: hypothetical protein JKY14_12645 [Paraglaciecola sp.]|nr:hypothetical protein [Paraglaciecola sp.]
MNRVGFRKGLANARQHGAVVLLTVVLLLIMVTLVTLYTGKIQSFEHRIIVNEQNQKWARAAAKSGLEKSIALIKVIKTLPSTKVAEVLLDKSHFSVDVNLKALSVFAGNSNLLTLTSTGVSADGLAKVKIVEQFLLYPILHNIPLAPLMVKDGFNPAGHFEIATNANGRGGQLPLSVWSDKAVVLSGTLSHSCNIDDFNVGQCQSHALSDHSQKTADVLDSSATFPVALVSYLFNIPLADWGNVKQLAKSQFTDCQSLDHQSVGLIWISGTCAIGLTQQIATKAKPIILVVSDGDLKLDKAAIIYGLVFSFNSHSPSNLQVNMQDEALIVGALVSNYQLGQNGETIRVVYSSLF